MFYTGKSTACHTCRQRRLKCDEVRPHCLKCRRAGRECLGYREESAFIIRDMTTATIQKFEHRGRPNTPAPSSDGSLVPNDGGSAQSAASGAADSFSASQVTTVSPLSSHEYTIPATEDGYSKRNDGRKVRKQKSFTEHARWRQKQSGLAKPILLGLPLEDRAFCYFANRYAFAPTQFLDPGYLPVLKVVSQIQDLGPCLSCSLTAVSLAAFSTKPDARKAILRARSAYATALQMTNEAIQRPGSCQDDQLLASVVLLALFEIFCSDNTSGWGSHIFGAAAMLGARGRVSFRDKLVRALFRVVSNESIKLSMLGVPSPHAGTEVWLRWLSDPKYMTYITPDAEAAHPNASAIVDLTRNTDGIKLEELASLKGSDAVGQVTSGRAGTLPVPQTLAAPAIGYTGPQSESAAAHISQALDEAKAMIIAYSMNSPPVPDLEDSGDDREHAEHKLLSLTPGTPIHEVDKTYQKLAQISLHVAACTARLLTYNVMARLAAAIPYRAAADYTEAVTMGRKEIREVLRMAPHFFHLIEEAGLTVNGSMASIASKGYESSSSSDNSDSSGGSGDGHSVTKKTQKQLPNLAKSYIGLMILWPLATAASTDLVDAEQFRYIMGLLQYIIDVCGIRMGEGVRQFCMEKRELSGLPFFA